MGSLPIAMAMTLSSLVAPPFAFAGRAHPQEPGAPIHAAPVTLDFATAGPKQPAPAAGNGDADVWSYEITGAASDRRDSTDAAPRGAAPLGPATARPQEFVASPMAPLPPGLLIAPIGLATAAWMTYRIKRRRGAI
jgi:hypothetical protein